MEIESVGCIDESTISIQSNILLKHALFCVDICTLNKDGSAISLISIVDKPERNASEQSNRKADLTC